MNKITRKVLPAAIVCSIAIFTGCGNSESGENSSTPVQSQTTTILESASLPEENLQVKSSSAATEKTTETVSSAVQAPVTPSQTETTAAATVTETNKDYLNNIAALPNKSGGCGFVAANGRDEKNVPNDMYWYVKKFGKYNADFIQDTNKNIVYLTMDEGYEAGHTPKILDTLKEKNVKAVFFVTKQFVDEHPDLVQRMIDEGHIVGNHTCSHPADGMPSLSLEAQKEDIMKLHNIVLDKFGYTMKLFRFPEGEFSEQSLALVESLGYRSVFWSFSYVDFRTDQQPDPAQALQQCMDELHPGAIYLLHAVSATNTEILGDFIDGVRQKGFEFGTYPVEK